MLIQGYCCLHIRHIHLSQEGNDRSKTTSFFLLLHFHLYCCFHSCAVIQLDVPLITTNVCVLRERLFSILHIRTWFVQRIVIHKASDLTSTSCKEYTLYWIFEHLNLLRPSKQTKTRFAICAKIPDVLMKYQTVASDMLPLTSTINDMGVIFTSLLTFDNPISFLVSHTLYIAFRIVFSLLLARSYYYNIKFKRKDQDFILMIYLKHFKLW